VVFVYALEEFDGEFFELIGVFSKYTLAKKQIDKRYNNLYRIKECKINSKECSVI
jgi:hypothetical protein